MRHTFNVFGRLIDIERIDERWQCHLKGADGKRGKLQLAIPPEVVRDELAQYLYDVYHEQATPTNGDVFELFSGPASGARN